MHVLPGTFTCSTSWTDREIFRNPHAGFFRQVERSSLQARFPIWEMRLKHNLRYRPGQRESRFAPYDVLPAPEDQAVVFPPMTVRHAACPPEVPIDHKDPFDEWLLVQAQIEDLPFLTVNRRLTGYLLPISGHELA